MRIPIIQIGNSKGIRLSKTVLEKYEIKENIELVMKRDHIELQPLTTPREGWEEAFMEEDRLGKKG
jgi:antitoxin MazE